MTPTSALATVAAKRGGRRLLALAAPAAAMAVFVAGGLVGLYHYVDSYWLYRGFPPPGPRRDAAGAGRSHRARDGRQLVAGAEADTI